MTPGSPCPAPPRDEAASGERRSLLRHWLPRAFVLGSVLAMVVPTPSFVSKLSRDERVLWWSEILWVLGVPTIFVAALVLGVRLLRRGGLR